MGNADRFQEHQKAINYIVEGLNQGRLVEGSRLEPERELAETLGVSRNSVREVLSILRGMGLVESRPGSGNYIVNNVDRSIKQMVAIMLKMGSISFKDVLDYRRAISRSIGFELIEHGISEENASKISDILKAMRVAKNEEFCILDREFHLSLINATENKMFTTIMEPIGEIYLDLIVDVILGSNDENKEMLMKLHEGIFDSIVQKDMDAFARYTKEHYDYVETRI